MFLQKPMLGTQIDWSNPLNDGVVLDLLMNEGHGDRVNDLSGWGNHGTLHGFGFPPTQASGWNPGRDGVCLTFDGVDGYIDCGNNPSLKPVEAFTIDVSIYQTAYSANYYDQTIVSNYNWFDSTGFILGRCGGGSMYFRAGDNSSHEISSSFDLNTLYRFIATLKGTSIKLYKNGILVDSGTLPTPYEASSNPLFIGTDHDHADRVFIGSIAKARILPRAMSAFEVMQTQIDPYGVYLQ